MVAEGTESRGEAQFDGSTAPGQDRRLRDKLREDVRDTRSRYRPGATGRGRRSKLRRDPRRFSELSSQSHGIHPVNAVRRLCCRLKCFSSNPGDPLQSWWAARHDDDWRGAITLDIRNWLSASSIPARSTARTCRHESLTWRCMTRTVEIIDSHSRVDCNLTMRDAKARGPAAGGQVPGLPH